MECIYISSLTPDSQSMEVPDDEATHLKALRVNSGDAIFVSNGSGLCAEAIVDRLGKNQFLIRPLRFIEEHSELPVRLGLALGILENRDRMEFALEKAVELGATDFYPVIAERSQKNSVGIPRLNLKALAALKQSKRARLITIHPPAKIKAILENQSFINLVIADEFGDNPLISQIKDSTLLFVGPEGGFTANEIELVNSAGVVVKWNLGSRRLRAETAAITALSFASMMLETTINTNT